MTRLVFLALVLAACGDDLEPEPVPLPAPPHEFEQPGNPRIDPPEGAADAAEIARLEWSLRMGVELPPVPDVRWFDFQRDDGPRSPCLHYSFTEGEDAQVTGCVVGLYMWGHDKRVDEIHLLRWTPGAWTESLAETGLAHEMLHFALQQARGNANGKHDDWMWSQVDEVSDTIREAGL